MSARPAFPHNSYANLSSPWRGQGWLLAVLLLCGVVLLLPMLALVATALGARHELMGHLIETVLFRYLSNTFLLMLGVGVLALALGVSCAWVVSRYEFPYRRVLAWMLLLPLAMPSYIIAYVYTGFLDYGGPVQTALRAHYGFSDWNAYWFPEIRSMGGAIFVMGFVLYPYVYLLARTGFGQIPTRIFEATMLTGRSLFWHVGLPIGRSAILAGCALVLMEVVADFGTVDFFAVETISLGVYNVWLGMNNITAAAQLALIAVAMVALLLGSERYGRRRIGFIINNRGVTGVPRVAVLGWWRWLLPLFCLVPIVVGFFLPVAILIDFSLAKGTAHLPDIGGGGNVADCWAGGFGGFDVCCVGGGACLLCAEWIWAGVGAYLGAGLCVSRHGAGVGGVGGGEPFGCAVAVVRAGAVRGGMGGRGLQAGG